MSATNNLKIKQKSFIAIQKAVVDWKERKEQRLNKDSEGEEEDEENIYSVQEVIISSNDRFSMKLFLIKSEGFPYDERYNN